MSTGTSRRKSAPISPAHCAKAGRSIAFRGGACLLVGVHTVLFSTHAEADSAFLRDALGLPHLDAGGGWLIFGLPPGELAVHPADSDPRHELFFMCANVEQFVGSMRQRGIQCSAVRAERWGRLTHISLPSGPPPATTCAPKAGAQSWRPKLAPEEPRTRATKPASRRRQKAKSANKVSSRSPRKPSRRAQRAR